MKSKYNRKVMIAEKPIHSHNRGPNQKLRDIANLAYFRSKVELGQFE